jgi:hypothetical protein
MRWSTSPTLRVVSVILLCSGGFACGLAAKTHQLDLAVLGGLLIAGTGTALILALLGIWKLGGRLSRPPSQEDVP